MCKPASMILTKDGCFHDPDSDRHQRIIEIHKLNADGARGPNIVPVEIVPPRENYSLPLELWVFKTDCDDAILPDWYTNDPVAAESRARVGLLAWAADHIKSVGEQVVEIGQERIAVGVCRQTINGGGGSAYGNATQTINGGRGSAYDNATQTVNGGEGRAHDNATQTINGGCGNDYNNATQTINGGLGCAYDNATQTINGGRGSAYDNATQTVNGGLGCAYDNATQTLNGGRGYAYDSATVTDNR